MDNASIFHNGTPPLNGTFGHQGLQHHQYSLFLANIVICSFSLVGNVAVLVLICQRRLLGRTTNVFVFSLAIADVICCLGAIPYSLHLVFQKSMSVYLCKSYYYALCVSRTAVAYTVILLTTEKILNIIHHTRFITAGRCMFFINLVWFFSTAYNVWTVVFYTIYDSDKITSKEILMESGKSLYGQTCFFHRRFESLKDIFLTSDFVVMYVIPLAVLFIECVVIVKKQHGSLRQRFEAYYYIMRFIFFIFIVYILCHTPFEIAMLLKSGSDTSVNVNRFYEFATTIYYTRGLCFLVVYIYFKQYVCRLSRLRTIQNSSNTNKTNLEIPLHNTCNAMSLNELRILK